MAQRPGTCITTTDIFKPKHPTGRERLGRSRGVGCRRESTGGSWNSQSDSPFGPEGFLASRPWPHFDDEPPSLNASRSSTPTSALVLHNDGGFSHALELWNSDPSSKNQYPSVVWVTKSSCPNGTGISVDGNQRKNHVQVSVTDMKLEPIAQQPRGLRELFVQQLEQRPIDCYYRYICPVSVLEVLVHSSSHLYHGLAGAETVNAAAVAFIASKIREDYHGIPKGGRASSAILEVASLKTFDDVIRIGAFPSFSRSSLNAFITTSIQKLAYSTNDNERVNLERSLHASIARLAVAVRNDRPDVVESMMKSPSANPRILGTRLGVAISTAAYMDKLVKERQEYHDFYAEVGLCCVRGALGSIPFAGPALAETVNLIAATVKHCTETKTSFAETARLMKNNIVNKIEIDRSVLPEWTEADLNTMFRAIEGHTA